MKTAIVYATKYGTTENCANLLSEQLSGTVDLFNIKKSKEIDLSQYDKVIIGSSIYVGKIQKKIIKFCEKNLEILKDKKIGLFICCMRDEKLAQEELDKSFPPELSENAVAKAYFGGELLLTKMNFLYCFIIKKIAKTEEDTSFIVEKNIEYFAMKMNNA